MKYFKTLDKPKTITLLNSFKSSTGNYPTTAELRTLARKSSGTLPSVKWIQNKGGIIPFYQSLGLHYTDARTGARRSNLATAANKKSQAIDAAFSQKLVATFGESNVHWQSPYNKGETLHRSDFRVYKANGSFFFVDLFFPQDMNSFEGCVNIKLKKLASISVEKNADVYFISCNETATTPDTISYFVENKKTHIPANIHIIHISEFWG